MDCSSYANTTHLVSGEAPDPLAELQLSDYLFSDDGFDLVDHSSSQSSMISPEKVAIGGPSTGYSSSAIPRHAIMKSKRGEKKSKSEAGHRVAFRTKSELEIMDDGFKWRKYGKKTVKNSPNPRNYYRCSSGGCNVKKRVERDREDSRYVITTYDGVHNHQNPFAAHNNQIPFEVSIDQWLLQASSPHDSFSS